MEIHRWTSISRDRDRVDGGPSISICDLYMHEDGGHTTSIYADKGPLMDLHDSVRWRSINCGDPTRCRPDSFRPFPPRSTAHVLAITLDLFLGLHGKVSHTSKSSKLQSSPWTKSLEFTLTFIQQERTRKAKELDLQSGVSWLCYTVSNPWVGQFHRNMEVISHPALVLTLSHYIYTFFCCLKTQSLISIKSPKTTTQTLARN